MPRLPKGLFSLRMLRHVLTAWLLVAGGVSILLDAVEMFSPGTLEYGWGGFAVVLLVTLAFSVLLSWPRRSLTVSFSHPDTKVTVAVGDLFKQEANLVIGFCDTFDTEIGRIVSGATIQGQLLTKIYGNNRELLDRELATALASESGALDPEKKDGKKIRYPIGTTITLDRVDKKLFCAAYSAMGNNLEASSNINHLWSTLQNIWQKACSDGEQKPIAMPVIGSYLARVPAVSYSLLIKLIVLSYVVQSRIKPVSRHLMIVVHESDMEKVDFLEIEDFLKSLHK